MIQFLGPMEAPVPPGHIPPEQPAIVECARRLGAIVGEVGV